MKHDSVNWLQMWREKKNTESEDIDSKTSADDKHTHVMRALPFLQSVDTFDLQNHFSHFHTTAAEWLQRQAIGLAQRASVYRRKNLR